MGDGVLVIFLQQWLLWLYMLFLTSGIFALATALCLPKWAREGGKLYSTEMAVAFRGSPALPQGKPSLTLCPVWRVSGKLSCPLFICHVWTVWAESFMRLHVSVQLTLCASVRAPALTSPVSPADSNRFLTHPLSCSLQPCLRLRARHFPAGTQCITSRFCRALGARIAPSRVAAGSRLPLFPSPSPLCPLPSPTPPAAVEIPSPFAAGWGAPTRDATHALQASALCNPVKPLVLMSPRDPCPGLHTPGSPSACQCAPRAALAWEP